MIEPKLFIISAILPLKYINVTFQIKISKQRFQFGITLLLLTTNFGLIFYLDHPIRHIYNIVVWTKTNKDYNVFGSVITAFPLLFKLIFNEIKKKSCKCTSFHNKKPLQSYV